MTVASLRSDGGIPWFRWVTFTVEQVGHIPVEWVGQFAWNRQSWNSGPVCPGMPTHAFQGTDAAMPVKAAPGVA